MCRFISSDVIIGNFIIEAVERNKFSVELQKLYSFDKELSGRLAQHNYYTNFNVKDVSCFGDQYPYLIESSSGDRFKITQNIGSQDEFRRMLIRYFRYGMPKVVINEMKQILQIILG